MKEKNGEFTYMKLYYAPLEGLTSYVLRNAHAKCFGGIDKYYMPFIATHQTHVIKGKELRDILSEHNTGCNAVPQLLTNHPEDFVWYLEALAEYGYREINLNLGCPSGTVVAKGKGAGLLRDPDALDEFLEASFARIDRLGIPGLCISAKTRIGIADSGELEELLPILCRYPFSEITVHPRLQKQMYKGIPDMEAFQKCYEAISVPLIYNGDIWEVEDAVRMMAEYPKLSGFMMGRGILQNPALGTEIRTERKERSVEKLIEFHELVLRGWIEDQGNERNVLFRMKELWVYLGQSFVDAEKPLKKIKKAKNMSEYRAAVDAVFRCMLR